MTVEEILNILEERVAPVKLSDDFCKKYGMYDNSGIIINCGNAVTGVLFTLDLSPEAVSLAEEKGYNLIVTHHPAIYGGISRFDLKNNAQARALAACLKSGISVISMHLNFDVAPHGIDYYLMRALGGEEYQSLATVQGGEYGRAYEVAPTSAKEYLNTIAKNLNSDRVVCYGDCDRTIKRVVSFCGAGCDDAAMAFAKSMNADALISSDLKHHQIAELVACGITVIQLTHYSAEAYGLKKIFEEVGSVISLPSDFYFDKNLA